MASKRVPARKDRVKDRSNIGVVEFPIEKLMEFRLAEASCVHIEAAMEADINVTHTKHKKRLK
jgi:hypothetical protein